MFEICYKFILIFVFVSFTFCDISSPVTHQPMKYSHIHLEIYYSTNNGFVKKELDYAQQNILLTFLNSKLSSIVYGRLIVVKSDDILTINSTIGSRMSNINGACSKISTVSDVQWIALVLKGGKCSIKEKIDNVRRYSNASAIIILDNVVSKGSERYDFNNNIGLRLKELPIPMHILLNESIFINASIIVNNFYVDGFISRTSVLFVSISFILLMVISLVWLIFFYIQRFRYIHAKERLSRRLANAAKKALDKIPLKILSVHDQEVSNDYDQCAICIDNYNVGETIRILPCKHIFHKVCIDSWLIEQRSCPMCKVDILKACGVFNSSSTGKTSVVRQGLWSSSATATATAALLEAGITDESLALDTIVTHHNTRVRNGHSTFLQRYRDRYGLHHCQRGCRRDHFHKLSRNFHEHCCMKHNDNTLQPNDITLTTVETCNHNQLEPERTDLTIESEKILSNQHETALHISIPIDDDKINYPNTKKCIQNEFQEIADGVVQEICECSSDNTNNECDVCDHNNHNSGHASTTCSCETCSDCHLPDVRCGHYTTHRHTQGSGIGDLLKCCITSNTTVNTISNTPLSGHYCCQNRPRTCSYCNISISSVCKNNCSKSVCTKVRHCQLTTNPNSSHFFQPIPCIISMRPTKNSNQSCLNNNENSRLLKSIKNKDKTTASNFYSKYSNSDEFDYETDNGSSSIDVSVPAVKLTVLPPQVQCHQGPMNTVSDSPKDDTATRTVSNGNNDRNANNLGDDNAV